MGIGREIKRLRLRAGLTQGELATRIGVTPAAVGNYECDVSFPKEKQLMRLFHALECTPNELLGGEISDDSTVWEHLEQYMRLDRCGRDRVNLCTAAELERCGEFGNGSDCQTGDGREVLIAARNNGSPQVSELTPRDGVTGIFDAPDYRGGR